MYVQEKNWGNWCWKLNTGEGTGFKTLYDSSINNLSTLSHRDLISLKRHNLYGQMEAHLVANRELRGDEIMGCTEQHWHSEKQKLLRKIPSLKAQTSKSTSEICDHVQGRCLIYHRDS